MGKINLQIEKENYQCEGKFTDWKGILIVGKVS